MFAVVECVPLRGGARSPALSHSCNAHQHCWENPGHTEEQVGRLPWIHESLRCIFSHVIPFPSPPPAKKTSPLQFQKKGPDFWVASARGRIFRAMLRSNRTEKEIPFIK